MNIVVLDIGGSSVKFWRTLAAEPERLKRATISALRISCGRSSTASRRLIPIAFRSGIRGSCGWGRPAEEAVNLGPGWVGFGFAQAFNRPVRIMKDAQMQALGSYQGGRMLYLGRGTGVGTTLITEGDMSQTGPRTAAIQRGEALRGFLTKGALAEIGAENWRAAVAEAALLLPRAVLADYVLIGGRSVEKLGHLPEGCRRNGSVDAYFGGL